MLTSIVSLPQIVPAAFTAGEHVAAAGQTGFQMASAVPEAIAGAGNSALGFLGQAGQTSAQGQAETVNIVLGGIVTVVASAAIAVIHQRYRTNLLIGGQDIGGFMPVRSFPEAVVDTMTHGLKIFCSFDELKVAWNSGQNNDRDNFDQYVNDNGELVASITRQPWIGHTSAYKAVYIYTADGELKEVVARRFGGIFGDRSYTYIPRRELPPLEPPAGKELRTEVVEIGDDSIAQKIHPAARAEGDEIKIYQTADDFKMVFGKAAGVDVAIAPSGSHIRLIHWQGDGRADTAETIAFGEAEKRTVFFGMRLPINEVENYASYSGGILEVVYDRNGNRITPPIILPGKDCVSYQVRYLYSRNGQLLKVVIIKNTFQIGPKNTPLENMRLNSSSEVLFTYKPSSARERRDSVAATDRSE